MKRCPFCAEEIQDLATKCRYCREKLELTEATSQAPEPQVPSRPDSSAPPLPNIEHVARQAPAVNSDASPGAPSVWSFLIGGAIIASGLLCLVFFSAQATREKARGPFVACKSNLKNIGTALEMFSVDNEGRYPVSLDQLEPKYLSRTLTCPSGSGSYGFESAAKPDTYTVVCKGRHHAAAGVREDHPQYSSLVGLLDGVGPKPSPPEPSPLPAVARSRPDPAKQRAKTPEPPPASSWPDPEQEGPSYKIGLEQGRKWGRARKFRMTEREIDQQVDAYIEDLLVKRLQPPPPGVDDRLPWILGLRNGFKQEMERRFGSI